MSDLTQSTGTRQLWLKTEFVGFFIAAPILIAILLPPQQMFNALFLFAGVGLVLLSATRGFRWRSLRENWRNWRWTEVLLFCLAVFLSSLAIVLWSNPAALFNLPRQRPELLVLIWTLYPLVSALPQELFYRVLYFRRYDAILPTGPRGDVLNAALFSLAHLMYWSWIVALMTLAGGLLFAWAYRKRGSFFYALLLHGLAGNILFATGMGIYFYSGNVVRPF